MKLRFCHFIFHVEEIFFYIIVQVINSSWKTQFDNIKENYEEKKTKMEDEEERISEKENGTFEAI